MPRIPTDPVNRHGGPATNGRVESSRFNLDKMREAAQPILRGKAGSRARRTSSRSPCTARHHLSEFIRVRDDDDYWIECMTLDYAPENGRKETYFIDHRLLNNLAAGGPERSQMVAPVHGDDPPGYVTSRGASRSTTADRASSRRAPRWSAPRRPSTCGHASHGRTGTAMCRSTAQGDFGDPQWAEHTFEELLDLAFKDTYIDSLDHPAIRDLMGLGHLMGVLGLPYREIWAIDFEFVAEPGCVPEVVCMVAGSLGPID